MFEVTADILRRSTALIAARSGVDLPFTADIADQFMDRVRVQFTRTGLHNVIAGNFESARRGHFFLGRWQWAAAFLARLRARYPALRGEIDLWLDDVPTLPGLVFSMGGGPGQFAIPDSLFLESDGYRTMRDFAASTRCAPWRARKPIVFWRGVTTGRRTEGMPGVYGLPRARMCRICADTPGRALFDVRLTGIVQIGDQAEIDELTTRLPIATQVPQETFGDYQFAIDIDGNSNSWPGLFTKLLLGTTVLKVASAEGFSQWYYDRLTRWVHFIPILADMSDLVEKARWAAAHPDAAEKIALAGQALAMSLTPDSEIDAIAGGLSAYIAHAGIMPPEDAPTGAVPPNATLHHRIMSCLHGEDIWAGFAPGLSREQALSVQGWNGQHACFQALIAQMPTPLAIDVGAWKGQASIHIAEEMGKAERDGCVISIDTFLGGTENWDNTEKLFSRKHGMPDLYATFLSNVFQRGLHDVIVPMAQTPAIAARVIHARGLRPGLIHLDASRDYEDLRQELRLYWDLLASRGFLVVDDFDPTWPGVMRAVEEFCREREIAPRIDHPKCIMQKP